MADSPATVVVVGAGGHASVVAEAVGLDRIAGHLAPHGAVSGPSLGVHLGDDADLRALAAAGHVFAIGIGFVDRSGAARRSELLRELGDVEVVTVVHPQAIVSPSAKVGAGSYVGPGAVVGTGVTIGRAAIVNTGAIIDHDCRIGDNVHIGPGVAMSGGVTVGDDTLIGVGATVLQGVRIGMQVVVGAGAVVIADLPSGATAVGVPARAIAEGT